MKKAILLTLALILTVSIAMAGETPVPTCDCEVCAADGDQTCRAEWTGILYICAGWYATYCDGEWSAAQVDSSHAQVCQGALSLQ